MRRKLQCLCSHHNNTALMKQISLFYTANSHDTHLKFNKKTNKQRKTETWISLPTTHTLSWILSYASWSSKCPCHSLVTGHFKDGHLNPNYIDYITLLYSNIIRVNYLKYDFDTIYMIRQSVEILDGDGVLILNCLRPTSPSK